MRVPSGEPCGVLILAFGLEQGQKRWKETDLEYSPWESMDCGRKEEILIQRLHSITIVLSGIQGIFFSLGKISQEFCFVHFDLRYSREYA